MQVPPRFQGELDDVRAELESVRAERDLFAAELALRNAALDAAASHFMIVSTALAELPIVYVNRACAIAHGYRPEELLGRSVRTMAFREQLAELGPSQFQKTMQRGQSIHAEAELVRRDGSTFWAGFVTTPLLDPATGRLTHFVTVGADITARREAERRRQELQNQLLDEMRERERMAIELRLAQKLEAVGRLATGLAHEINTPIQYVSDSVHFLRSSFNDLQHLYNACRTLLSRLCETDRQGMRSIEALESDVDLPFLVAEVPRAFERTLDGTDRVADIVRAMKEFAHPDAVEHTLADLNQALTTTLTIASNEYKYLATVETDFADLPSISCNVGELNQVFLNLIVNAAHAIADAGKDSSSGRIIVKTRLVGSHVEVEIADNGCGIDAENVEKIFDPFFTTKEVGRGTGQGLAIARSIVVEKHRGRIDVSSTRGAGTSFVLLLPLDSAGIRAEDDPQSEIIAQLSTSARL